MNIKKLTLFMLGCAVTLNCTFALSQNKKIKVYDYASAMQVKQNVINNLEHFEENNDGQVFTAAAYDTNDVTFSEETNAKRSLRSENELGKKATAGVKTNVAIKYDVAKDQMIADVKQTTSKANWAEIIEEIGENSIKDVINADDILHHTHLTTNDDEEEQETTAEIEEEVIDEEEEVVLVEETTELTPKLVHHDGDDEVYVIYDGQEFNLREYVEMAQNKPQNTNPNSTASRAILVDDLAAAAILAIAAVLFTICVSTATVGVSTHQVEVTTPQSNDVEWYEVVAIVLFWPFMILTSDTASSSTTYEEIQVFDPTKTSFEIDIEGFKFLLKGFATVAAAQVAIKATTEHYFYPCLFFPKQGWFFMSPIPLENPRTDATAILLKNTRVSFDQMHINKNDYAKEVLLEIEEALSGEGSIISVYTPLQSDAYDEIKYVNTLFEYYLEPAVENHARVGRLGVQFTHYHPGNHSISDSHMCFGVPIVL